MRETMMSLIIESALRDNSVFLTADLGFNCVEKFQDRFPNRFFNLGIAEQNMIGVAAGLALEGKKVFAYSIGNFASLRCLEQLRNDVCYPNLDVNIISMGAGLEYGQLGHSHHAIEDMACLRALPNLVILTPATVSEAEQCTKFMLKSNRPCYIRLNKKGVQIDVKCPKSLRPYLIKSGKEVAIFCEGVILEEVIEAVKMLEKENISPSIYSCPMIKPFKISMKELAKYKYIFSVEEHSIVGGLGSAIAELLAPHKDMPRLKTIGISEHFENLVGDRQFLRQRFSLDQESIYRQIKRFIEEQNED